MSTSILFIQKSSLGSSPTETLFWFNPPSSSPSPLEIPVLIHTFLKRVWILRDLVTSQHIIGQEHSAIWPWTKLKPEPLGVWQLLTIKPISPWRGNGLISRTAHMLSLRETLSFNTLQFSNNSEFSYSSLWLLFWAISVTSVFSYMQPRFHGFSLRRLMAQGTS